MGPETWDPGILTPVNSISTKVNLEKIIAFVYISITNHVKSGNFENIKINFFILALKIPHSSKNFSFWTHDVMRLGWRKGKSDDAPC